jgi:hypothetical protein
LKEHKKWEYSFCCDKTLGDVMWTKRTEGELKDVGKLAGAIT